MTTKEKEDRLVFLIALEHAGVDNWEGYDRAIDIYDNIKSNQQEE